MIKVHSLRSAPTFNRGSLATKECFVGSEEKLDLFKRLLYITPVDT